MYPTSSRYPSGELRLLYECNPMAFLIEQAGGKALASPEQRILDVEPTTLHQRCPLFLGSAAMVDKLEQFIVENP